MIFMEMPTPRHAGAMKDAFQTSGPSHLTSVEWGNAQHRRSVTACLVQGVYAQELDRQSNRRGHRAIASRWWKFFHFQLEQKLIDDTDSSIFGAIYKLEPTSIKRGSPICVIAFRGTILKEDSLAQDMSLNVGISLNILHCGLRVVKAKEAVQDTVRKYGVPNVWIAGHSLGSAIGMLVGKHMALTGRFLEAFFFNPPFISPPIEMIANKTLKDWIRLAVSVGTVIALVTKAVEHTPTTLPRWVPSLFVHPKDPICSTFISHFEGRKQMEERGAGLIDRIADQYSIASLLANRYLGLKHTEPVHLLFSARLITNLSPAADILQAHELFQWFATDMNLQSVVYN